MFNRAHFYNQLYSVDASVLPSDSDILAVFSPLDSEENDQEAGTGSGSGNGSGSGSGSETPTTFGSTLSWSRALETN